MPEVRLKVRQAGYAVVVRPDVCYTLNVIDNEILSGRRIKLNTPGIRYNYAICLKHDDINNIRSGNVMKRLGMTYQYSYEEQWQPKDILVTFRMYQLNLSHKNQNVYMKYWNASTVRFIETFQ